MQEFIIKISIALFLSALIGLERQWRKRSAGIRTNILVCLGAFLFAYLDIKKGGDLRTASQVITGLGFLGAGVILKDGANIHGLNTAATLWCSAATSILSAYGLLKEAIIGSLLILISNIFLRVFTKKFINQTKEEYIIKISTKEIKETLKYLENNSEINSLKINHNQITAKIETDKIKNIINYLTTKSKKITYQKSETSLT